MGNVKKFFGMSEDEAYADYLAFCKENDFKIASKEDFLIFMGLAKEEFGEEDGNTDD